MNNIPIEVERKIFKFCQGLEKGDRIREVNRHKKAYADMIEYVEKANIPEAEKEGILRNVENMFPGNYVRQFVEAKSMVETVLIVQSNMQ